MRKGGFEEEGERVLTVRVQMRFPCEVWWSWKQRKRRGKEKSRMVEGDHVEVEDIAEATRGTDGHEWELNIARLRLRFGVVLS